MDFTNKTVGVFFGGQSPEHDISIITGQLVLRELKKMGIKTVAIYISTDGSWCLGQSLLNSDFVKTIHQQNLYSLQRWSVDTRHRTTQLTLTRRPHFFAKREKVVIDVAFPAFHGAYGEDGSIQGLFEIVGVPYVGSGVEGSALAMNKGLTKRLLQNLGVPTAPFDFFSAAEWNKDSEQILKRISDNLQFPVFVKPANAGSSIGITRVKTIDHLSGAIMSALAFGTHCLVENGVSPLQDLTCSVRTKEDQTLEASLIQESTFAGDDFFSYEEKYLKDGGAQLGEAKQKIVIPANILSDTEERIQRFSKQMFSAFNLSGIGRVDFLYNPESRELYVSEINTMPGTLYQHLWTKSGVSTGDLLSGLLKNAMVKHSEGLRKNTYFKSPILGHMSGNKTQR